MLKPGISHQRGLTLIELMVGLAVSLAVLLGISVVYLNTTASSKTTAAATQINEDLRAMMDIMVADIRRAGSWGTAGPGTNPFTVVGSTDVTISTDGQCILYSYDATYAGGTAGVVDALDVFGFRVSNGVLQTLVPGSLTTTAVAGCTNDTVWDNLSDGRSLTLTMNTLSTSGSQCVAFVPSTYVATNSGTYTTWTNGSSDQGPACSPTSSNAPSTYPAATNTFLEKRQIQITLTAQSKSDTTLSSSLSDTALIRNDRVN